MANGDRRVTKHDVEYRRIGERYGIARVITTALGVGFCLLVATVPLNIVGGMVTDVAGKTTIIQASFALKAGVSLSLIGNGFQFLKGLFRRNEIKRLRRRVRELEQRLNVPEVGGDD